MQLKKQQYCVEVELSAPIETCFETALSEQEMKKWIPDVKDIAYDHSAATEPYHPGSVRHITMSSGTNIQERINLYQPPFQCGYEIDSMGFMSDLMLSNYQGLMIFEAIDDNKTRFIWQGNFDCKGLQKITEPLVRKMVSKVIYKMAGELKAYIANQ
jgi:hypothetical protein